MMKFMDPGKPIATCISETCDNCTVLKSLHCHFTLRDLMYFLLIACPSFLLGGLGIYRISGWWLIPWLIIIVAYFGFIEIRVMCSHCPHYAEEGTSLKCWANYGSPKLWKYRPGPMSILEKIIFFAGFVFVWGPPVFFMSFNLDFFLLFIYLLTVTGFFVTLSKSFCFQCMNFACPLNKVKYEIRQAFFDLNPDVAKAWAIDKQH